MTTTKKPAPHFVLSGIPNTPEGRAAIAVIKKHTNHGRYGVRVRANGPRAAAAIADGKHPREYFQSLPQKHAATFRVYFDDPEATANYWRAQNAAQEAAIAHGLLVKERAERDHAAERAHRAEVAHVEEIEARQHAEATRDHAVYMNRRAESRAIAAQAQLNAIPAWVLYACGLWADIAANARAFMADMKADR